MSTGPVGPVCMICGLEEARGQATRGYVLIGPDCFLALILGRRILNLPAVRP